MFGTDEAISITLIHDFPILPNANGGTNEMTLEGKKLTSLISSFMNSEEQHGTHLSRLEEVTPNISLLVTDSQATQVNTYMLLSEIV